MWPLARGPEARPALACRPQRGPPARLHAPSGSSATLPPTLHQAHRPFYPPHCIPARQWVRPPPPPSPPAHLSAPPGATTGPPRPRRFPMHPLILQHMAGAHPRQRSSPASWKQLTLPLEMQVSSINEWRQKAAPTKAAIDSLTGCSHSL